MMLYVVVRWLIKDDPFSPMTAYGPFETEQAARDFATARFGIYWRLSGFTSVAPAYPCNEATSVL